MILLAGVFAWDGFVPASEGNTYSAAPGTADWDLVGVPIPPPGIMPVNPMTDLATLQTRVQLSVWIQSQAWENDNVGNMVYQVHLHDGTVLGSGVYPAHSTVTGKLVLVDTVLAAGIIDNNAGIYVTWHPFADEGGGSGEGSISQRLNLTISATPA